MTLKGLLFLPFLLLGTTNITVRAFGLSCNHRQPERTGTMHARGTAKAAGTSVAPSRRTTQLVLGSRRRLLMHETILPLVSAPVNWVLH